MTDKPTYKKKPSKTFQIEIEENYKKYIGELDDEGRRILGFMSGNGFNLFKKLIATILPVIEEAILEGKYDGYLNGNKLTEEQKKDIIKVQEDMKVALKGILQKEWSVYLTMQKFSTFELFAYIAKKELAEKNVEEQLINNNTKKDDQED